MGCCCAIIPCWTLKIKINARRNYYCRESLSQWNPATRNVYLKRNNAFYLGLSAFVFFSNVPTYLPDDVEVFNQQHDEWVRCMVGANQGECLSPSLSNSLSLSPSHFLTLPDSTWIHNLVSCTRVYLYTLLVVGICDPDFMPLEGGITSTACLNGPLLYKDLLFKIRCLSETLGACTVAIETTIFLCS